MCSNVIKNTIRKSRKYNYFMLHHVDSEENKNKVSLSYDNFVKFTNEYEFCSINCKTSGGGNVITFDDGSNSVYNVAYKLLKQKQIPFTIFVTYSLLDTPGFLTKEQLKELDSDELVTIGSHSVNHIALPAQTTETKRFEVEQSKAELEKLLGHQIDCIAYPYGQFDGETLRLVKQAGYKQGFSAAEFKMPVFINSHLCKPRINICNSTVSQWIKTK